jgi:LysM repeat protein
MTSRLQGISAFGARAIIAAGMSTFRPTGLRMLAPVSLALFAVVFLIVVVASLGGDSGAKDSATTSTRERTVQRTTGQKTTPVSATRRTYVVKSGDTLVKISEKTGVSIEQLLSLNPSIDPQGLVTGQRVKLRE